MTTQPFPFASFDAAASAPQTSRRHFLKIASASLTLSGGIWGLRSLSGAPELALWRGESLGGPASISLWHPMQGFAQATLLRMQVEIARLDRVFSLHRIDSEISRLNAGSVLNAPSRDLVHVLDAALRFAEITRGAFDPTVQPIWEAHDRHFIRNPSSNTGPEAETLAAAQAKVGFERVGLGARRIVLAPGMAVTLNGIAQGFITDRLADLLQQEGFGHAMVELGETRALGGTIEGAPFKVGLKNPLAPNMLNRSVLLEDRSLSVSGGYGTRFGASGGHHIFDPATGRSAQGLLDVAVLAPRAMLADALSTAIYVAGQGHTAEILAAYADAQAIITLEDGSTVSFRGTPGL